MLRFSAQKRQYKDDNWIVKHQQVFHSRVVENTPAVRKDAAGSILVDKNVVAFTNMGCVSHKEKLALKKNNSKIILSTGVSNWYIVHNWVH